MLVSSFEEEACDGPRLRRVRYSAYPTVDAVTGYSAWSHTYDHTVYDELDLLM
jgi:hypothetical protein